MIWIHYSLEQRHHILYKESYKKHFKIRLKDTSKWPQMPPSGGLGATLEPARHQGRKLHPSLSPQGPQMRPIWSSMGTLRSNKSTKFDQKSPKNNETKKQRKKCTSRDPPKPQKLVFYYSKTHVFRNPPYPQKVTKMTPKWPPNCSKMSHTGAKRPLQHLPENEQKTNTKKEPQKH